MIQHLPSYVRPLRKQLGLSQSELGKLIGEPTQSSVARFETGIRYPSFETIIALRTVFNCSIERLYPAVASDIEEDMPIRIKRLIAELNLTEQSKLRDYKLQRLGAMLERVEEELAISQHG